MKSIINTKSILPPLFFLAFLLLGLFIYKDYGISADEMWSRIVGLKSLEYLSHLFGISSYLRGANPLNNPELVFSGFADRDYGVIFTLPVEWVIHTFSIVGPDIYYMRHLMTFLTFWIACIAFYKTINLRYSDWRISLVGVGFLILSPRIFGDSFYNDKDLVFLSLFIIATYTFTRFIASPSLKNVIYHALASAIAINCRLMAIILPVVLVTVLIFLYAIGKNSWQKTIKYLAIYLIVFLTLTILLWPWLWSSPFENLTLALKNMAHFRTVPNLHFQGEIISAKNLPWFYLPVWIAITTPILYLLIYVVGFAATVKILFKKTFYKNNRPDDLLDVIYLGLSISPIMMVITLHSVLYNGWRHLYFIYPAFILVCLCGIKWLFEIFSNRPLILLIMKVGLAISLAVTAIWMVRWHPYQYLYFNVLAGNWAKKYDLDYWGVAYLRPLKKILAQDSSKSYAIFNNVQYDSQGRQIFEYFDQTHWLIPYSWNNLLLKDGSIIINRSEACSDYVFLPERGGKTQYYLSRPEFEKFDEVKVGSHIIYSVFKRRTPLEDGLYSPNINETIIFADPNTRCFLFQGWNDGHESWGVWSNTTNAKLWLRPAAGSKQVMIDFRAMVNKSHPEQNIIIKVSGGRERAFQFKNFDSNKIILDIPPEAFKEEFLKIDLEIPNAISPLDLGLSQDGRKLGVGIKAIQYLP
jgi:hypothetical protein